MPKRSATVPVLSTKATSLPISSERPSPLSYFVNKEGVLLYHGAIDNDRSGKNIQDHYLKTAFDAALGGKAIEKTRTNAFGCTIKRAGIAGE